MHYFHTTCYLRPFPRAHRRRRHRPIHFTTLPLSDTRTLSFIEAICSADHNGVEAQLMIAFNVVRFLLVAIVWQLRYWEVALLHH